MEIISNYTNNVMQRTDTLTNSKESSTFYRISLYERLGRYDSAISLPILKGTVNPRLRATSSVSKEECLTRLLEKIKNTLLTGIKEGYITSNNLFNIFDNISISIKNLKLDNSIILTHFHNIVSCIYGYLNTNIIAPVSPLVINSVSTENRITNTNIYVSSVNNQIQQATSLQEKLSFKEVAIKWFHYKYSFTEKNINNPNPLSRKTLQDYNKTMNLVLIPFFEQNTFIDNLSDDDFQTCIDSTNGSRQKEAIYIVLKMILDFARTNNYISYSRTIKKPLKAKKKAMLKIEGHDFVYIETSRQPYWIDCFEKENTDISLLFEGMLVEGFRPEEACGLDWTSLVEDSNYFVVSSAYKDFPVYNENAEVIGHVREYDTLKTDESYRKIPVHPRYREKLLQHKEWQKKEFKRLHLRWSEHTPIFLNRYHKPYVAENLSKCLKSFREKYHLEYLTPYGLRHSFATYLSEKGVRDIVLMKLMGHAEYSTTQKYYIFVSDERKKREYEEAWGINVCVDKNSMNTEPDEETVLALKQIEALQTLWIKTLIATIMLQKNNA